MAHLPKHENISSMLETAAHQAAPCLPGVNTGAVVFAIAIAIRDVLIEHKIICWDDSHNLIRVESSK